MSITENLAGGLKQLSDDDAGFENIKSGAGNVVNVLGGMISSSSGGGNASSSTNSSQTTVCCRFYYFLASYPAIVEFRFFNVFCIP